MAIRFFVICYGSDYADIYERIAIRSLTQPRNLAAIPKDAVVSLYSDAETMPRVAALSEKIGKVEPHILELRENHYDTQNQAFIREMEICAKTDAGLVIVNPDCFWGDGSLENLLAIAGDRHVCLASAHVRVDKQALLASPYRCLPSLDNPQLVSLAMQTLHPSWRDAYLSKPQANSFYTGIGIRWISPGMWEVHHLLPTIFYARVTMADYAFFAERPNARGLWDHAWPAILVQQGRQRTIASSDAFFVAELTDAASHNTELRALDPERPDEFCRSAPHIDQNRSVIAVWRC